MRVNIQFSFVILLWLSVLLYYSIVVEDFICYNPSSRHFVPTFKISKIHGTYDKKHGWQRGEQLDHQSTCEDFAPHDEGSQGPTSYKSWTSTLNKRRKIYYWTSIPKPVHTRPCPNSCSSNRYTREGQLKMNLRIKGYWWGFLSSSQGTRPPPVPNTKFEATLIKMIVEEVCRKLTDE